MGAYIMLCNVCVSLAWKFTAADPYKETQWLLHLIQIIV